MVDRKHRFRVPGEVSYTTFSSPVPEPEIYGMFMAGLGLLGFMSHRRMTFKQSLI